MWSEYAQNFLKENADHAVGQVVSIDEMRGGFAENISLGIIITCRIFLNSYN